MEEKEREREERQMVKTYKLCDTMSSVPLVLIDFGYT